MQKLYLDETEGKMCLGLIIRDVEVIRAGTTVSSMSVKHKNDEYRRFAEEYDINFIFDNNIPTIDFYTIPQVDIFAIDRNGGYIGSLGQTVNLESNTPICYIGCDRKCYLIAQNGLDFLQNVSTWKTHMELYNDIKFYCSKADAQKENEFFDTDEIEKSMRSIKRQ